MRRHISYLKYLIRHKYYVFLACRVLKVPLWQALFHDWSKFLPSEWLPYARTFYSADGKSKLWEDSPAADVAWLKHQHRNPHHWQHWVLREDSGGHKMLPIPDKYLREMVADWAGAGRAIHGRWDVSEWYEKNRYKMQISHIQSSRIAVLLTDLEIYFEKSNNKGKK